MNISPGNLSSAGSQASTSQASTSQDKRETADSAEEKQRVVAFRNRSLMLPVKSGSTSQKEKAALKRTATRYEVSEPPEKKAATSIPSTSSAGASASGSGLSDTCTPCEVIAGQEGVISVQSVSRRTVKDDQGPSSSTVSEIIEAERMKAEIRKQKNRESARKSREKAKVRETYLQEEIENVKVENFLLEVQNFELIKETNELEDENERLRQKLLEKEAASASEDPAV